MIRGPARAPRSFVAGNAGNGLEPTEAENALAIAAIDAAASKPTTAALLDYEQLSGWLGIKIPTLRAMVSRRTIPCLRLGPRLVRFSKVEISRWLEERRVEADGRSA